MRAFLALMFCHERRLAREMGCMLLSPVSIASLTKDPMPASRIKIVSVCFLALLFLGLPQTGLSVNDGLSVIPRPRQCQVDSGSFTIGPATPVVVSSKGSTTPFPVDWFVQQLRLVTGFPLKVQKGGKVSAAKHIEINYVPDKSLGEEGYTLEVTKDLIRVRASSDAGHFYAAQTMLQLLPPAAFGSQRANGVVWSIPCLGIMDSPRFSWRGVHLDVSRHFFPASFVRRAIDILAMHKLNVFHWHLTDDQGWRIEIKKYPKLTQVGAWRADRSGIDWNLCKPQQPGEKATYGGFYTQNEIREIVKYAQARNVTIVPEIEMPAHTTAALAAYPQFSCTGGPFNVTTGALWPITDIFCAGNDSTFTFLQDVLTEVMDLFPGTFIHIGGDEADKANWKKCPKCQARIKKEGLEDEGELQSYFIRRIAKFVASKGRRAIGWDEILEGGLAPEAAVMSWRGTEGGLAAARMGHDVVMTPGSHTYFNAYQGKPEFEPPAGGGYLPLRKVYSFEPVPDSLTGEQAQHVLGGEACLWSEHVLDPERAEYMYLPRLAAIAEVFWSPKEQRNPDDFFTRIEPQLDRYQARGYAFGKSLYSVSMSSVLDTVRRQVKVALFNESTKTPIRYTLDGTDPTPFSAAYIGPFVAEKSLEIRAVSVKDNKVLSAPTIHHVYIHKAVAKPVTLKNPYNKYSGGGAYALTNGICGAKSFDDGTWQGFEGSDLDATIDLGAVTPIKRITVHFLQDHHGWIFAPTAVQYDVSEDGKTFTTVGTFSLPVPDTGKDLSSVDLAKAMDVRARYVRVFARNLGVCPDWHPGHGGKAWLFVDEIIVE
jgi:hexosaminidase